MKTPVLPDGAAFEGGRFVPDDALERAAAAAGFTLIDEDEYRQRLDGVMLTAGSPAMFSERTVDGVTFPVMREVQSDPLPAPDENSISSGRLIAGALILTVLALLAGWNFSPHG